MTLRDEILSIPGVVFCEYTNQARVGKELVIFTRDTSGGKVLELPVIDVKRILATREPSVEKSAAN